MTHANNFSHHEDQAPATLAGAAAGEGVGSASPAHPRQKKHMSNISVVAKVVLLLGAVPRFFAPDAALDNVKCRVARFAAVPGRGVAPEANPR